MQGAFADIVTVDHPQRIVYRAAKRALDLTIASALLLVLLPVLLVCVILVWRSSPGPILFRQSRVGLHGHEFTFLKFRSMRTDADPEIHRQYVAQFINGQAIQQEHEHGLVYKLLDDPRITKAGHWLRRTSLDELPQLINVLRGEMSLVGPRPPIPYELEHYRPEHYRRLAIKPGITGLWQVNGRSATTFEEMVELDVRYINEASLLTDLKILAKTIPAVISKSGA
jgi:exopolysaccharide biosynthesis polyprenyl glycosylphosphotransferase